MANQTETRTDTWQDFLDRHNQREFGATLDSQTALSKMLDRPVDPDPNDATNQIVKMLKSQL